MHVEIRETPIGGNVREFLDVVDYIYRDDPCWVRPLDMDLKQRLSLKNPFFEHGEASIFTAYRNGWCVGRCTAQIDRGHLDRYKDDVGFFGFLETQEFIVAPNKTWMLSSTFTENTVRWIYTDGSGHGDAKFYFPRWGGSSIGFWTGDSLIVHTNQIKGWRGGPGGEFSDKLETVEKYRRMGDRIEGEITLYDPDVFVGPAFERLSFRLNNGEKPEDRPTYNTCTDTNGPSPGIYLDENGFLNAHAPGDPGFTWDPTDPRPWGTWLTESDRRYQAYLARGGKAPANQTPSK